MPGVTVVALARSFARAGHSPTVYCLAKNFDKLALRQYLIPAIDRIESLSIAPDLVLGTNLLATLAASLNFPGVPVILRIRALDDLSEAPVLPRVSFLVDEHLDTSALASSSSRPLVVKLPSNCDATKAVATIVSLYERALRASMSSDIRQELVETSKLLKRHAQDIRKTEIELNEVCTRYSRLVEQLKVKRTRLEGKSSRELIAGLFINGSR